jgi:hypothetical protein
VPKFFLHEVANTHTLLIYANNSATMIVKPGPADDFLLANQKVDHRNKIDWAKVMFFFLNAHENCI